MSKKDTRCLECLHEFPAEVLVLSDETWVCPRCASPNVETIIGKAYDYETTKVKYCEGNHD